jgi:hypothetical protein
VAASVPLARFQRMNPTHWEAAEWGAFGQVGALVVATVAGVLVWLQVRHGRQVREDQTRPYVIVDFESQRVNISFDPPLQSPLVDDPQAFVVFSEGIPMLAPGRAIRHTFGTGPQFFPDEGEGVPLRYEARVQYTNLDGKPYEDPPLVLDLLPFKHSAVDREDLHQIYQNLKDIKNLMKSWTSERRLRVNTETQTELSARHREWLEARHARGEAQQEQSESE